MSAFLRENASAQGCISNPGKQFRFPSVCGTAYAAATLGSGLQEKVGDHSFVQIFLNRYARLGLMVASSKNLPSFTADSY